ncbi:MAG: ABC transporter substrate-binding protein [Thaumarchaeota archaeon]|nr:ABC transporter substrate-binding protein [Nitrososphaerota archaeon]
MRSRAAASVALMFLLVLSSLGGAVAEMKYPPPTGVQGPRYGGTFVIGILSDPPTLNPSITTSFYAQVVAGNMYQSLLWYDLQLNPHPQLALSWSASSDGLSYTFHLVNNASWSDGVKFTSADVKYSFESVLKVDHALMKNVLANLVSVNTPDGYTAVFVFSKPSPSFMSYLGIYSGGILPAHIFNGTDPLKNPADTNPTVTLGPFLFKEWAKGDHLTLVKNPNYYIKGVPYIDTLTFKILSQGSLFAPSIQTGEINYAYQEVPPSDFQTTLANVAGVKAFIEVSGVAPVRVFAFNLRKPILSKLAVRQAIADAINITQMAQLASLGIDSPATSPQSSVVSWAHANNLPQFSMNLTKANQLLDQAGYPKQANGTRFTLQMYSHLSPDMIAAGQILVADLAKLGVNVNFKPLAEAAMDQTVYVNWDFDLAVTGWATGPDPGPTLFQRYDSQSIVHVAFTNAMGYNNSQVDQLLAQAGVEPVQSKRAQLYDQVQQILVQDLPVITWGEVGLPSAVQTSWVGLQTDALSRAGFEYVWSVNGNLPVTTSTTSAQSSSQQATSTSTSSSSTTSPQSGLDLSTIAAIAGVAVVVVLAAAYAVRRRSSKKVSMPKT